MDYNHNNQATYYQLQYTNAEENIFLTKEEMLVIDSSKSYPYKGKSC